MKQICIATTVLGAALICFPVLSYAQMPVDIGKREYALSCSVCHGDRGN
jgi:mono/diheme cytochrome c family protein